jgi:hypothetical protein
VSTGETNGRLSVAVEWFYAVGETCVKRYFDFI